MMHKTNHHKFKHREIVVANPQLLYYKPLWPICKKTNK